MYEVVILCRAGTHTLDRHGWRDDYHPVTWTVEPTCEQAWKVALGLMDVSPYEVADVWVNERRS